MHGSFLKNTHCFPSECAACAAFAPGAGLWGVSGLLGGGGLLGSPGETGSGGGGDSGSSSSSGGSLSLLWSPSSSSSPSFSSSSSSSPSSSSISSPSGEGDGGGGTVPAPGGVGAVGLSGDGNGGGGGGDATDPPLGSEQEVVDESGTRQSSTRAVRPGPMSPAKSSSLTSSKALGVPATDTKHTRGTVTWGDQATADKAANRAPGRGNSLRFLFNTSRLLSDYSPHLLLAAGQPRGRTASPSKRCPSTPAQEGTHMRCTAVQEAAT